MISLTLQHPFSTNLQKAFLLFSLPFLSNGMSRKLRFK
uniref:Uncharacterized protein n=1 Tax=Rhizophora mucronata TaxID=61149 RepID=A0A2P2N6S8_RHIMU